jgi:hypothetical protein
VRKDEGKLKQVPSSLGISPVPQEERLVCEYPRTIRSSAAREVCAAHGICFARKCPKSVLRLFKESDTALDVGRFLSLGANVLSQSTCFDVGVVSIQPGADGRPQTSLNTANGHLQL